MVTWNGAPYMRVSFQAYNTHEDLAALMAAHADFVGRIAGCTMDEIALALGAGGVKGIAHIGVIRRARTGGF